MLQLAILDKYKVLYVSGEESEQQVKMRAERVGILNPDCLLLTETYLESILDHATEIQPTFLIIDSIQTIYTSALDSSPGSVSQIKECTAQLLRFAKPKELLSC